MNARYDEVHKYICSLVREINRKPAAKRSFYVVFGYKSLECILDIVRTNYAELDGENVSGSVFPQ